MKNRMIKVALVGYGYWGPNLLRNFFELENSEVLWCCDLSEERLTLVSKRYPGVKVTKNLDDVLSDKAVDAILIATPTTTHFNLAKKCLLAGKHVWVEKPMTDNSLQAKELIALAKRKKKILHVDHVFVYTDAVRLMRKMIDSSQVGDIYYFDSVRINLGLFQRDTNVIWDLAPHDISIMLYLLKDAPKGISAYAQSHVIEGLIDTAHLSFEFKNNVSAHINVSWLSPVKIRRSILAGGKKMIVYDDLEASDKIKVYDKGLTVDENVQPKSTSTGYQYRIGDVFIPALANTEALKTQAKEFLNAISTNSPTPTSGEEGLKVVKILEAASRSLTQNSKFVEIDQYG